MGDNLKPEDRKKTMRAVKSKGSKLEKRLWSMLAGMRLKGWIKNSSEIIGKPDVIFPEKRIAVFIDGCFWHGCPECRRKMPETNRQYWTRKIHRNVELAEAYNLRLQEDGWIVIRIWEHEMTELDGVRIRILDALKPKDGHGDGQPN